MRRSRTWYAFSFSVMSLPYFLFACFQIVFGGNGERSHSYWQRTLAADWAVFVQHRPHLWYPLPTYWYFSHTARRLWRLPAAALSAQRLQRSLLGDGDRSTPGGGEATSSTHPTPARWMGGGPHPPLFDHNTHTTHNTHAMSIAAVGASG